MKTIFFLVIAVIFSCIFSKANADENEGTVDLGEIVHIFPIDEGTDRVFYQKIIPGYYQLMVQDFGKNPIEGQRVPTPYRVCDRYPEEDDKEDYYTDGFEFPIVYKISLDKRFIYLVPLLPCNGNGYITAFQLLKVDCKTKECSVLAEFADICVTPNGFTIQEFEPLSEGTSMSIIEEQWRPFETDLNWNGKRISKKSMEFPLSSKIVSITKMTMIGKRCGRKEDSLDAKIIIQITPIIPTNRVTIQMIP